MTMIGYGDISTNLQSVKYFIGIYLLLIMFYSSYILSKISWRLNTKCCGPVGWASSIGSGSTRWWTCQRND